jgi:hypothetical protein
MKKILEYSEQELYEITQLARLKFLGEEVAKQAMTEDELIVALMACLKYIDLDIKINSFGKFEINEKMGLVTKEGFVLPLYDEVWEFAEGFASVKQGHKYGHINTKGELLADKWYDFVLQFQGGFAVVRQGDKYGHINTKGELLADKWYDDAWSFKEGFAKVIQGDNRGYIDKEGNFYEKKP